MSREERTHEQAESWNVLKQEAKRNRERNTQNYLTRLKLTQA